MSNIKIPSVQLKISNARLSFPFLFAPRKSKDGKPGSYGASFLIDKNDPQNAKIQAIVNNIISQAYPGKDPAFVATILNGIAFKDGAKAINKDTGELIEGYDKTIAYIQSSSKRKPLVQDINGNTLHEDDGTIYAGCIVHGVVNIWWQDNEHGKRVNAELLAVRKVADGESFGVKRVSENIFNDMPGVVAKVDPLS